MEMYKEIQPNTSSVIPKEVDEITNIRKQVLNQHKISLLNIYVN